MRPNTQLEISDIVQLNPDATNPSFAGCLMVITEPIEHGAKGYVQTVGNLGGPSIKTLYRAKWSEMELVGAALWVINV